MDARANVTEPDLRKDRTAIRKARHVEDARVCCADIVVARKVRKPPGPPERRNRAHHDLRVELAHSFVIKPHPLDYARREVLHQYIDLEEQFLQDRQSARFFRINADAFLAAILLDVVGTPTIAHVRYAARDITVRRNLDLDYLGAHLTQVSRGGGPRQRLREIKHLVTVQHSSPHFTAPP